MAVSSTDVGLALTKTSSAMATLGNDANETIGLVAAGVELMPKQAGKVSRGLRTIGNNLGNMANKSGELSFKVQGSTKNISLLDKKTGELKSTFGIFKDVNKSWDKMSSSEQQALGIALAGKNQFEVFTAVQKNFSQAIFGSKIALDSEGSAMKENSKYMESLEAKVNNFKAEWQELVFSFTNSDFVKGLVDAGTAVLHFINNNKELIGTLLKIGATVAGVKLLESGFLKLVGVLKTVTSTAKAAAAAEAMAAGASMAGGKGSAGKTGAYWSQAAAEATAAGAATANTTAKVGKASKAISKVGNVAKIAFGKLGMLGSIVAIGAGVGILTKKLTDLTPLMDDLAEAEYTTSIKDLKKTQGDIVDYTSKIANLKEKIKDGTATAKDKELLEIYQSQLEVLKEQEKIKTKKSQNNFEKTQTTLGDEGLSDIEKSQFQSSGMKSYDEYVKSVWASKGVFNEVDKSVYKYNESLSGLGKSSKEVQDAQKKLSKAIKEDGANSKTAKEASDNLNAAQAKQLDAQDKVKTQYKSLLDTKEKYIKTYGSEKNIPKELRKSYASLVDEIEKYENLSPDKISESPKKAVESFKDLVKESKRFGKSIGVAVNKTGELKSVDVNTFTQSMLSVGNSADFTAESIQEMVAQGANIKTIDADSLTKTMTAAGYSVQDVYNYLQLIGEANPEAKVDIGGTEVSIKEIKLLDGEIVAIPNGTTIVTANTQPAKDKINGLIAWVNSLPPLVRSVTTIITETVKKKHAKGTKNASKGLAEVNEEGFEIIKDGKTGKARIAGGGERTVTHLNQGDIVYTHQESKDMVNGKDDEELEGFAKGTSKKEKWRKSYDKKVASLDFKLEVNKISEASYMRALKRISKKAKMSTDQWRDYQKKVFDYQSKLAKESIEKRISYIETESGYTASNLKKALDELKKHYKAKKITAEEYKEYLYEINNAVMGKELESYKLNKITYKQMKDDLYAYAKAGKITWEQYYERLDELNEEAVEKYRDNLDKQMTDLQNKTEVMEWYADKQQSGIESQIKALEKEKEAIEATNDEREKAIELAELQQNLEDAKKEKARVFKDGRWQYVSDERKVQEAQKALDSFYDESKTDAIDKQIEVLEEESDKWSKYVDEYKDTLDKLLKEQELGMTFEEYLSSAGVKDLGTFSSVLKELVNQQAELNKSLNLTDEQIMALIPTVQNQLGYASGSNSIPIGGVYKFNENGDELSIPPSLNYAPKNTGVVPHTMAENLREIGMHTWSDIKSLEGKNGGDSFDNSVNIQNMTVEANNPQEFLSQMKNLVNTNK